MGLENQILWGNQLRGGAGGWSLPQPPGHSKIRFENIKMQFYTHQFKKVHATIKKII